MYSYITKFIKCLVLYQVFGIVLSFPPRRFDSGLNIAPPASLAFTSFELTPPLMLPKISLPVPGFGREPQLTLQGFSDVFNREKNTLRCNFKNDFPRNNNQIYPYATNNANPISNVENQEKYNPEVISTVENEYSEKEINIPQNIENYETKPFGSLSTEDQLITESVTTTDSGIDDFETTTLDDPLNRMGVPPAVVASVLG